MYYVIYKHSKGNDDASLCLTGDITLNLLLPLLPEWVTKVTGVDLSKEMVDFAAKNSSHNSIDYQQLDIENGDNPRQRFPEGFTKVIVDYYYYAIKVYRLGYRLGLLVGGLVALENSMVISVS